MIDIVIQAQRHDLGGFEVGRVLPYVRRRMVGPFIFFDHMGPVDLVPPLPANMDVRPHPHIGLATVTYLFAGEIVHRDSVGCQQVIRSGDVNWMTAGRGISHSERFDTMRERGGRLEGIQAWVALPNAAQEVEPAFVHMDAAELPLLDLPAATLRIIAGSVFGLTSPLQVASPLFYVHAMLSAGARVQIPDNYSERAAYVVSGEIEITGQRYSQGQMLVFTTDTAAWIEAHAPATVMLLGGEPVGERHIWWNFVSATRERIEQGKADWQAGRIALPVDDDREFIPLPQESKVSGPLS